MDIDFNDENLVSKKVKELVKEIQKSKDRCDPGVYKDLSNIMETIGQDNKLYEKYQDLYMEAEDELMMAGADLAKCGCDPLKRQIPPDKT